MLGSLSSQSLDLVVKEIKATSDQDKASPRGLVMLKGGTSVHTRKVGEGFGEEAGSGP